MEGNRLVTTTSKWMESLLELAEKALKEREKFEALMIEQNKLIDFMPLNNALASFGGFALSAKYILKDNEPDTSNRPDGE